MGAITHHVEMLWSTPVGIVDIDDDNLFAFYTALISNNAETLKAKQSKSIINTVDYLHKLQEFESLCNMVNTECLKYFSDIVFLDATKLAMSSMWANIHDNTSNHVRHNHPNSYMSGVLYLNVPDDVDPGMLVFTDPRQSNLMFRPDFTAPSHLSHGKKVFKPKRGRMFLFPSWLMHGVDSFKTNSGQKRICVSFNYVITSSTHEPTMRFDMKDLI